MSSSFTSNGFYVLNNQTGQVKVCWAEQKGKGKGRSLGITCSKASKTH